MLVGRPMSMNEIKKQVDMIEDLKNILGCDTHKKIVVMDDRPYTTIEISNMQLVPHIATLYPAPPLNFKNNKKKFNNIINI